MRKYLETLISEKGGSTEDLIPVDGHFGLTYAMLIDFIETQPQAHKSIRKTLVAIDFKNGDVFHFLQHLGAGMVAAMTIGG